MTCLPSFRRLFVVAIIGSATAYAGVPPSRAPPLSAAAVAAARERAAAGSRDDHYLVGLLYTFGESLPRDVERALVHFRAAAALGHVGAATAAGALLEDSDAPDARGAALDFYRRAGRAGDAEAQYRAARLLLADPASGSGDAVVALLRQATSSGHAAAHWLLAVMLEAGWRGAAGNGTRDVDGAAAMYDAGCTLGAAECCHGLAMLALRLQRPAGDWGRAVRALRRGLAADAAHGPCHYELGRAAAYGLGGEAVDYDAALGHFAAAATSPDERVATPARAAHAALAAAVAAARGAIDAELGVLAAGLAVPSAAVTAGAAGSPPPRGAQ